MARYLAVVAKRDDRKWTDVYGILDTSTGDIASYIAHNDVEKVCSALESGSKIDLDWSLPGTWFHDRVWTLLDGNPIPGADDYLPGKFGAILGS